VHAISTCRNQNAHVKTTCSQAPSAGPENLKRACQNDIAPHVKTTSQGHSACQNDIQNRMSKRHQSIDVYSTRRKGRVRGRRSPGPRISLPHMGGDPARPRPTPASIVGGHASRGHPALDPGGVFASARPHRARPPRIPRQRFAGQIGVLWFGEPWTSLAVAQLPCDLCPG
jgi:hypothetical protein